MIPFIYSLVLAMLFFTAPQPAGIYVASTPCNKEAKALKAIPAGADCEFMKWKLTLYPTTYELSCTYGMTRPNTNGFTNGATVQMDGKWSIIKGMAAAPSAIVYQLTPAAGGQPLYFVKLNDDLLHLLDSEKHLWDPLESTCRHASLSIL